MAPTAIRFRALLGRTALVLASVLVAVTVGEVLARFAFPPIPETLDEGVATLEAYQSHPVIGWLPRPNASVYLKRFTATLTTTSRGLRDREHYLDKVPGVQRTEVVNLGVTAFGVIQKFEYPKLEGMLYQSDIVVLAFCQNDIAQGGKPLPTFRPSAMPARQEPASAPSHCLTARSSVPSRL